jgi:hypothetical protein
MNTGKSLLLGTAAGLVAVAGAQAADMPVKAKPVEYVKICNLYGDGYYYIPGSDTCIKIGGYVRADYGWNVTGARTPQYSGANGPQDRTVAPFSTRHRANIAIDTRTQTQFGTLRTLTSVSIQNENQTESFNVHRAFIQWAGFTFGRAQSYSDTWYISPSWHLSSEQVGSDSGDNGVNQIAYTFEWGRGFTTNIGADERRTKNVTNFSVASAVKVGADPTDSHSGERWPDPYINFRVDQSWGYWGITLLAHDVSATYYTGNGTGAFAGFTGCTPPAQQPGTTQCGHPDGKIGWVIMQGGEVKLPMLGPADRAGYMAHFGVGTSGFSGGNNLASPDLFASGNNAAVGWITDGVYVNGSAIELTTSWAVGAGYEHSWGPTLKTSVFGAYARISYDAQAQSYWAGQVCGVAGTGATASTNFSVAGTPTPNCNPNWGFFQGGVRTQWTPVPGFFLAVESFWTQVFTAFNGTGAILAGAPGARPTGVYNISNQGIWGLVFRAQRNFNVD